MKKIKNGICKSCGRNTDLTYEHIPPKSAFNNNKHFYITKVHPLFEKRKARTFEELVELDKSKAIKKQGGIGFFTLCAICNNNFGTWYVRDYLSWVKQSIKYFESSDPNFKMNFKVKIKPLNVLKQIMAMFLSINSQLTIDFPEIKKFLLKKNLKLEIPKIRVFIYYNIEGEIRYEPNFILGKIDTGIIVRISEISFPPFGYVLITNGETLDERLFEITNFGNFDYNEEIELIQNLSILPTHLKFVGDYRTEEEIEIGIKSNLSYIDSTQFGA